MKKVAIISEKFSCGGLETRVITLAESLKRHGVEVFLIVGQGSDTSMAEPVIKKKNIIKTNLSILSSDVTRNVFSLINILQRINPDIIHLHPFSSLVYGSIAAGFLSKPFLITIHSSTNIYFGQDLNATYAKTLKIICPHAEKVYCSSKKYRDELLNFLGNGYKKNNVDILNNSLNLKDFAYSYNPKGSAIIVSRLNSDKITGIINTIKFLRQNNFNREIVIYGDGESRNYLEQCLKDQKMGQVSFEGISFNTASILKKGFSVAAGIGRSAIEYSVAGIPTIIFSHDGVLKCMVTYKNIKSLAYSNFSGQEVITSPDDLASSLNKISVSETKKIRTWMIKHYDQEENTKKYLKNFNLKRKIKSNWYKKVLLAYEETSDSVFGKNVLFWLRHSFPDETEKINQLQIVNIQNSIEQIKTELDSLAQENISLHKQLQSKQNYIDNLHNTFFWQVIKSFRSITKKFKKSK